jgi:hypothetical protein
MVTASVITLWYSLYSARAVSIKMFVDNFTYLDCSAVSTFRHAIAEVKQCWSVIGWVTKNLLSQAPPCFGRHVKPLVPAAFAVVSTHHWASVVGYGPFFLCVVHKEGLRPSSGDINSLMVITYRHC